MLLYFHRQHFNCRWQCNWMIHETNIQTPRQAKHSPKVIEFNEWLWQIHIPLYTQYPEIPGQNGSNILFRLRHDYFSPSANSKFKSQFEHSWRLTFVRTAHHDVVHWISTSHQLLSDVSLRMTQRTGWGITAVVLTLVVRLLNYFNNIILSEIFRKE